ncbi:2,3-bisphosphoglycerate-dependent phosphoglycerate mutase [Buchnera aphidicola (Pterocallis alni)]|uniref:2,3-diphosphoglycerate-dependent phosphoglycerate mutase n=1 Tax=Buchnera aphidicola TaxID=9 RepID=UPI003463FFB9
MKNTQLVLMRHGESTWNQLNQFTGWTDVKLSVQGKKEAKLAGKLLKKKKFIFDVAYTSLLKRAIHTLWIVLKKIDQSWITVKKNWRLNERHYGKLQGLNKKYISEKYGEKQVEKWRRDFKIIPPCINVQNHEIFCNDPKYKKLKKKNIPTAESLQSTLQRVIPYWEKKILLDLNKQKNVLIIAHGNSLRALIKYLSNIDDNEISNLHIPTGIPIVYTFNKTISREYTLLSN